MQLGRFLLLTLILIGLPGCHAASVTSVPMSPWNRGTAEGIPFYLPKPLLVVAKNVRHNDEAKIGLTNPAPIPNAFDNQASYGDIKANVTAPGSNAESVNGLKATDEISNGINLPTQFSPAVAALDNTKEQLTPPLQRIQDGLIPDSFFTYQVVFVPDLSQKYGLRVTGKPGEVRAAMNLVNGWMYTGMGPYYLKDSSTAQNRMATGVATMFAGRAASQVLGELTGIAGMSSPGGTGERAPVNDKDLVDRVTRLAEALKGQQAVPTQMCHYAEVFIYEPSLSSEGRTDWQLVAHHDFTRDCFLPPANDTALKSLVPVILGIPGPEEMSPVPGIDSPKSPLVRPQGQTGPSIESPNTPTSSEFPATNLLPPPALPALVP